MKKSLRAFLFLAVALLVVGCTAPGGGGPSSTPNRGGSTTSTGGLEYVFTPDTTNAGLDNSDWPLYFFGLAYGNGTYVAVGTLGTVLTSTDGTDWYVRENNYNNDRSIAKSKHTIPGRPVQARTLVGARKTLGLGSTGKSIPVGRALINNGYRSDIWDDLIGVAYGAGKFVAIGYNNDAWSSPDGTSWTPIDLSAQSLYDFESIAFLNGKFVAFGYGESGCVVLTSGDGSSWSSTTLSNGDFYAGAAYGIGVYVAVTWSESNSSIYTSANGSGWTAVSNGSISLPASYYGEGLNIELTSVAFHDGVFVAVGTAWNNSLDKNVPLILVSTDGINWSSQDLPDLTPPGLGTANAYLTGIAATDAGFVAVGDFYMQGDGSSPFAASIVLTSTTGRSWQHDYYNSSLSGAVVSGNGISAVGLGDNLFDWY